MEEHGKKKEHHKSSEWRTTKKNVNICKKKSLFTQVKYLVKKRKHVYLKHPNTKRDEMKSNYIETRVKQIRRTTKHK